MTRRRERRLPPGAGILIALCLSLVLWAGIVLAGLWAGGLL